jgi:serralysin
MTNEKNYYCMSLGLESLTEADRNTLKGMKAALLNDVRWPTGAMVTVKFLEGSPELQKRVKGVALVWTTLANVNFEFVNKGDADVRIAFQPGGSWSYLGTACNQIPQHQPTMNYGWLTPDSSEDEVRRVVLHEFGHALGLSHEHQNPQRGIKWNHAAVIQDLSGPPNWWDLETIEQNMFKKYEPSEVTATDTDKDSIMMCPIPLAWTLDGFSAGLNMNLSEKDKDFIRHAYP